MPVDDGLLVRNRLLGAAPAPLRARLAELGLAVPLEVRHTFFEQGETIEQVVFPLAGVASLVSVMDDGRSAEIATVGNEGFVGLPVFLQSTLTSSYRALVQIRGSGVVFPAASFLDLSNSGGEFQAILQRYTQAMITQIAQGAACNRLHTVQQRCARWLLQTHDRVDEDRFGLTQEFLGRMIGVGRQSVNEAARSLQQDGLIRYTRGDVTVIDRAGLERASCECYRLIRDEFERLLPGQN